MCKSDKIKISQHEIVSFDHFELAAIGFYTKIYSLYPFQNLALFIRIMIKFFFEEIE